LAIGVDLGRVDEVDAEVEGAFDDRPCITTGVVVAVVPVTRAELPTAEPDDRHSGATHLNEAHAQMLPPTASTPPPRTRRLEDRESHTAVGPSVVRPRCAVRCSSRS